MEVPRAIRELVIKLRKDGLSMKRISEMTKKSKSTVQYIIERYRKLHSLEDRDRSGRPSKLNGVHKRNIIRQVRENPRISAPQLAADLMVSYNIKVSTQTVRNVLKKSGYH